MGKINWPRVLLGGVVWALVYNLVGAGSWLLYRRSLWRAALEAQGSHFQETVQLGVSFILVTFLGGVLAVWLYAAIRPRYGAGPKTAACAGVAVWLIGYLLPAIVWGVFLMSLPRGLLVTDAATCLVGALLASLAGAWPYKE
jgi:hypothetical protein